jgi:membrane dipeptidase
VAFLLSVAEVGGSTHVAQGIGTAFDGGFGMKSTPADFDTVADLQIIAPALEGRGYSTVDVELIMNGNWVRVLKGALG